MRILKKNIIKILVSIVTSIALMLNVSPILNAANKDNDNSQEILMEGSVYWSAEDKVAFATEMTLRYYDELANGNIKTADIEEIDRLVQKCIISHGEEKQKIRSQLEEYGVYFMEPTAYASTTAVPGVNPDNGDVTIEAPELYMMPSTNVYFVGTGGHWNNNNWNTGATNFTNNIGGYDAFGVIYSQISGEYKSSVTRASATLYNETGEAVSTTSSRSDGDGEFGFGFQMQDYKIPLISPVIPSALDSYVGYEWSGTLHYDNAFLSRDLVATSYYIHTYDKAYISDISFGVSGEDREFSANIQYRQYSFIAYSTDSKFGVGW